MRLLSTNQFELGEKEDLSYAFVEDGGYVRAPRLGKGGNVLQRRTSMSAGLHRTSPNDHPPTTVLDSGQDAFVCLFFYSTMLPCFHTTMLQCCKPQTRFHTFFFGQKLFFHSSSNPAATDFKPLAC